jgi:tetratricopeptide (TPR) repeat protein
MQREATSEKLKSAEAFMSRRDYDNALKTVAEILAREPDHAEAQVLRDAARYGNGRRFLDKNQDTEALREFGALKPTYQDTAQLMALARGRLAARAESHYRSGVKHFLNEELEKAVAEWEKTLALNPEHRKARQDMENAQRLLDKLRGLEKK